jgi:hypothetical protein
MSENKIDFISDLLGSKKIEPSQKERVFILAANELKKNGETDEKIFAEIEEIKIQLKIFKESEEIPKGKNAKKIIHKPKDVANFMYLFNKRDGFKYLTHDYDEEDSFDIKSFLEKAIVIFKTETKKLSIPTDLWQIVNQFAFSEKPNWGNNIKEGFSTPKWTEWSKTNALSPIRNKEFEVIINKFRDLTRIESPNLENIIEDLKKDVFENSNFKITQNRLDKADFYTNTITFKSAVKSIFEIIYNKRNIKEESNFLNIMYKGSLQGNYYEVKVIITHVNSYPSKDFAQLHPEWKSEKGAIGKIKKKLFGYCDWSIESKFENGCYRINLLKGDSVPDYDIISEETVEGTKHILSFYYKTSD